MQWSFEKFEFEREDLRQDLTGLDLDLSKCRIGDFACGWGYVTLGLMLELQCHECIGVDRCKKDLILDVPSIPGCARTVYGNLRPWFFKRPIHRRTMK